MTQWLLLSQTESWSNYGLGNVEEHQRHSLLRRLEEINQRYRCAPDRFTLYENKAVSPVSVTYRDYQWHSMLRILSVYAMLNPSIGYIQGMHEILLVLLRVFFAGRDHPAINIQPWESKVLGLGSTCVPCTSQAKTLGVPGLYCNGRLRSACENNRH